MDKIISAMTYFMLNCTIAKQYINKSNKDVQCNSTGMLL